MVTDHEIFSGARERPRERLGPVGVLDPDQTGRHRRTRRPRYEVNERFFDHWNPPMAWVLGLLMSSGYLVGRNATVRWGTTDVELVQSIRTCLESNHRIVSVTPGPCHFGDKPIYFLSISRMRMRAAIDALLPVRRQAERTRLPDVPQDVLWHFVRGYFEGHGSIYLLPDGLRVRVSGNAALLEDLRMRLRASGVEAPGLLDRQMSCRDSYALVLRGHRAFRLVDLLYRNAPAELRAERKHRVYVRYLGFQNRGDLEARDA